jgi:DNA polymerase-3 subunit epsilon
MREIILDTETTGLDAASGDRIVEIAGLELENRIPTGTHFQRYINPERDMPEGAFRIHGLSADFLAGHPVFADLVDDFLTFIAGDPLVIHNAEFDLRFLNAELKLLDRPPLANRAIDTVALARRKFPGAQVNLDALCRRFEIDNSARTFHGALLDCELLAEVYASAARAKASQGPAVREARAPRPHEPGAEELAAHESYLDKIEAPIWRN